MILRNLRPSINFIKCTALSTRNYRTECEKIMPAFSFLSLNTPQRPVETSNGTPSVLFNARSIIHETHTPRFPLRPNILDFPVAKIPTITPYNKKNIINDILPIINDIDCPTNGNVIEKKAVRLIIQRRKKMKKHQLKKWRKKYKFLIRKRNQRKNLKKEKVFQAVLIAQIKEAESFDPEQYVVDKLKRASEVPIKEKYKKPPITSNVMYHPGYPDEVEAKK